jgi:heme o synthase
MPKNFKKKVKAYYWLTKPGIIRGNAITALAGFFLASNRHVDIWVGIAMLIGLSLIVASACVFNNFIDRNIDKKMARTQKRAIVSGTISGRSALIYATILGIVGSVILGNFTNLLALCLALFGLFAYVVLYSVGKRLSTLGTVVGSISGAVPPVVGYAAVTGRLDAAAVILFFILVFWQMPHFFAIAMYRRADYAAAGLPVLPVKKGMQITKLEIILYIFAFGIACLALYAYGYTGLTYLIVSLGLTAKWLQLGLKGFGAADDSAWARRMFRFSLLVIALLCLVISLNSLLP